MSNLCWVYVTFNDLWGYTLHDKDANISYNEVWPQCSLKVVFSILWKGFLIFYWLWCKFEWMLTLGRRKFIMLIFDNIKFDCIKILTYIVKGVLQGYIHGLFLFLDFDINLEKPLYKLLLSIIILIF